MNLGEHLAGLRASAIPRRSRSSTASGGRRTPTCSRARRSAAGGLAALGVGPGDRVAVALRNRIETALLYWASAVAGRGVRAAQLAPAPGRAGLLRAATAARASLAIEGASAEAGAVLPDTPLIAVADAPAGEPLGRRRRPARAGGGRRPRARAHALHLGHDRPPQGRAALAPRRARGGARAARPARAAGRATARSASCRSTTPWACAPCWRRAPAAGCFCSQSEFRTRTRRWMLIERERLTSLYLAPTLFHDLLAAQRERPRDLSSVRALAYAGASMARRAGRALRRGLRARDVRQPLRLDRDLHVHDPRRPARQAGLRRAPGAERAHPARAARCPTRRPTSSSRPARSGRSACALSSDEAFAGYWKRPDADARQIRDGWYFPGDLGELDADGDLYLVGRIDDMIVSGGGERVPARGGGVAAALSRRGRASRLLASPTSVSGSAWWPISF